MLDQMKCPNCGAPINRFTMRCEYCGSVFDDKSNQFIIVGHPGVHVLQASRKIGLTDLHKVDPQILSKMILDDMTKQIAESLAPFIEIFDTDNIEDLTKTYLARVRVLDSNYRF